MSESGSPECCTPPAFCEGCCSIWEVEGRNQSAAAATISPHPRPSWQMALARQDSGGQLFNTPVVVLADRTRDEMEEEVRGIIHVVSLTLQH